MNTSENLILIGMPGSGKSTVGVLLAKQTARAFVDTDLLIQTAVGRPLQDIVDSDGYVELRRLEEEVLLGIDCCKHVIATGGSAVYSDQAMMHLKTGGRVVFLDVDLETLQERVGDFSQRGLAKRPDQTFAELFAERGALYRRYADITVQGGGLNQDEVCERVVQAL